LSPSLPTVFWKLSKDGKHGEETGGKRRGEEEGRERTRTSIFTKNSEAAKISSVS
jgi:hypothetical protein